MPCRLATALLALGLLVPVLGLDAGDALAIPPQNCGPDPLSPEIEGIVESSALDGAGEASTAAAPVPGTIQRLSFANGVEANDESGSPVVSANGRFVAFHSSASNLVAGDTNGTLDVFVYDRLTGSVERVSVSNGGIEGNGQSIFPSISGTGRFVAFRTAASNLVFGDTNGRLDIMVYDRMNGSIERATTSTAGAQANRDIETLNLSQNGRVLLFSTTASNLVPGDTNGVLDAFVRNLDTGVTTRPSISNFNLQPNGKTFASTISADGRYIAFRSFASNLVGGDTNRIGDDFVFDRVANRTWRINVTSKEVQVYGQTFRPTLSANGRFVVFRSRSAALVPGDTNVAIDVFVRDRAAGTTKRVSLSSSGRQANAISFRPTISGDGRYVVFASQASTLVPNDTNGRPDVFRHDRRTGKTIRLSVTGGGRQVSACSINPRTDGDGNVVVFTSVGRLVAGDTNGVADVFARVLPR